MVSPELGSMVATISGKEYEKNAQQLSNAQLFSSMLNVHSSLARTSHKATLKP